MSKKAKNRQCPAVGRDLSATECGENRVSRYACPADCSHNPFAPQNYSQLLTIEGKVDRKCMARLGELVEDRKAFADELDLVLLGQSHWRLEAFGAKRLADLRGQFEAQLDHRVRFSGERVDDLAAAMSARQPTVDAALVPGRLLEKPQQSVMFTSVTTQPRPGVSPADMEAQFMSDADRAFLEDAIPALGDRTPREAAGDPELRPQLIRLLKQRVRSHDERNLKTGRKDDINWLLEELGAAEILFEPPPWRPTPPDMKLEEGIDAEDEFERDERDAVDATGLPPAPQLSVEPMSFEEASGRLSAALDTFDTAADAMNELGRSGATLLEDAGDITGDLLDDEHYAFVVPYLLQAWFALVPVGCRAPRLEYDALEQSFVRALSSLTALLQAPSAEGVLRYLEGGPQPALVQLLAGRVMEACSKASKQERPPAEALPVMLALLKAVVEGLCAALRQPD